MSKGFEWKNIPADISRVNKAVDHALSNRRTAVVFDTETTGIVGKGGIETEDEIKIIQFSGILYHVEDDGTLGDELDRMDTYIFPEEPISEEVTKVTGITDETLANAPTEREAAWKIERFMSRADTWIAYNAPYDLNRLDGMARRTETEFTLPYSTNLTAPVPQVIDVLPMAKNVVAPEPLVAFRTARNKTLEPGERDAHGVYKLQYITPVLFPDFEAKFHDSLEDVRSTAKSYNYLRTAYSAYGKDEDKCRAMGFDRNSPNLLSSYQASFTGKTYLNFGLARFKVINPYHSPRNTRRILIYTKDPCKENDRQSYSESGIFYDVSKKVWTCDSKPASKKLFQDTDLVSLEHRFLDWAQYRKIIEPDRFTIPSMDDACRNMETAFNNSKDGEWVRKVSGRAPKQTQTEAPPKVSEKDRAISAEVKKLSDSQTESCDIEID